MQNYLMGLAALVDTWCIGMPTKNNEPDNLKEMTTEHEFLNVYMNF